MDPAIRKQLQNARLKLGAADQQRLDEVCEKHGITSALVRDLLVVEDDLAGLKKRNDIFNRLADIVTQHVGNG